MTTIRRSLLTILLVLAGASLRAADQVVTFSAASYTFHENDGVDAVTVNRTGDPSVSFSVDYNAFVNSVTSNGTLSFGPNEMSKAISLKIPNDDAFDVLAPNSQGYFITLHAKPGVSLGAIGSATINLIEDEPRPTVSVANVAVAEGNSGTTDVHVQVTLSGPLKRAETIYSYATGGTATLQSDYQSSYTFYPSYLSSVSLAPRQTSAEIIVTIYGDTLSEPDETIFVTAEMTGASGTGIVTILNDDYILGPSSQPVRRGTVASLSLTTSVPTPATDHVELSSSDPGIATVPPFVDIPAGSLGKSFDVTTAGIGSAVITATLPPSRGGGTLTARVNVFTPSFFSFDNLIVDLALARTATVTAHLDPPPSEPLVLFLTQTFPSVASVPLFFTIGTNGIGSFEVQGTAIGVTLVKTTVPAAYGDAYGEATTGFRIDVSPAAGVAISRIDTISGPSTGGQRVAIYAAGMSTRCSVLFDGVSGLNTSTSTSGFLTTNTPPHDAGTVDVAVRCNGVTGTLPDAYTYTSVPARLTRLSPTIGPAGGGVLAAVTGENLRPGRCSLWFGGLAATTLQNDQMTSMLVAVPPHAPGSVDVTIRCGSDVSTLPAAFLYTGSEVLPQVAGVTPPSGAPGDRVIVSGSQFRDDDAIFFDSAAGLDVTSASDAHFVTVPDLLPGNVTITLRDVAGHSAAGPAFRVLSLVTPQITVAPTLVTASSEFPITGAGFRRSLSFLLGGTVLPPVAIASTYGQLRLPDSIGPGTYALTLSNQSTASHTIQVTAAGVAVKSVSIPCSSTEGGPIVTVKGNGFAAGAVVSFGAADSAEVTVLDEHTITARVPPSSGLASETITVTNPTGASGQLSNAFQYRWPDPGCGVTRHRGAMH